MSLFPAIPQGTESGGAGHAYVRAYVYTRTHNTHTHMHTYAAFSLELYHDVMGHCLQAEVLGTNLSSFFLRVGGL